MSHRLMTHPLFLYLLLLPLDFIRHIPPINNRLKPGACHLSPTIEKHTCNLSGKTLNLQRNINAFSVIRYEHIV